MTDDWNGKQQSTILEACRKTLQIREFCLYGSLVEMFPLQDHRRNKMSCSEFGHDCPVFYLAEIFIDASWLPKRKNSNVMPSLISELLEKIRSKAKMRFKGIFFQYSLSRLTRI